jgi:DNA-binding XRE family transcriptional regulator
MELAMPSDSEQMYASCQLVYGLLTPRSMKPRSSLVPTHCPICGSRIVPTPKELKLWRQVAGLSQRQMAARLEVSPPYVAYLENGDRSPSAIVLRRYWKFKPKKTNSRL